MSYEIPFGAPLGYVWIPNLPVPAHTNRFAFTCRPTNLPDGQTDSGGELRPQAWGVSQDCHGREIRRDSHAPTQLTYLKNSWQPLSFVPKNLAPTRFPRGFSN